MNNYRELLKNTSFVLSTIIGFVLLILSLIVNYYAGLYAIEKASLAVTDIILSNIPVYDVDVLFIYGPFVLWAFVIILSLIKPQRIPFILKSIALFILIRSIFITLTHIGPFPDSLPLDSDLLKKFTSGSDLFFSAHTGLPFLMALIFQEYRQLLILFTVIAIFFGAIVLMAHLHYSIDVLAAFFITYTIYHMACFFFKKDKEMFES
ncbi:MAG: phosphatase PAP2-related protein [bacterium]|nr:phosphatase PAP2-related protein [bacterium]